MAATPNPLVWKTWPWVAGLVLVLLGGFLNLSTEPEARWATPLVVAGVGALVAYFNLYGQQKTSEALAKLNNEQATGLAKLNDNLKKHSQLYERRLVAMTDVVAAERELIRLAGAHFYEDTFAGGTPTSLSTSTFLRTAAGPLERLREGIATLRIVGQPELVALLDKFDALLVAFDQDDTRDHHQRDIDTLIENPDRLATLVDALTPVYEATLAVSRRIAEAT